MRTTTLFVVFALVYSFVVTTAAAQDKASQAPAEQGPFTIGNRDQPYLTQIQAFTKEFLGTLRNNHRNEPERDARTFRRFIDPEYLEEHGLAEGGLPMRAIDFVGMRVIDVADDERTVLCAVEREDRSKLVVMFRVVQREDAVYIQPFAAPDEESGYFHPWIQLIEAEDLVGE